MGRSAVTNSTNSEGIMSHLYSAYGLTIESDICCPELEPGSGSADVAIRLGQTPERLDDPVARQTCVDIEPDQCLLRLEKVARARYLIRNGNEIIVDRLPDANPETLLLFLLSSCFSSVLYQRDLLPMHGNAIDTARGAIVIAGDSGAGKSTLALTLVRRGYRLITDDLCPITFDDNATPFVQPGIPRLKLWADTLEHSGLIQPGDSSPLQRVRPELDKYALPLDDAFCREATALHKIYVLKISNHPQPLLENLTGLQKLDPLRQQQMGDEYLASIDRNRQWMTWLSNVARKTEVATLTRPNNRSSAEELADLIEEDLQQ